MAVRIFWMFLHILAVAVAADLFNWRLWRACAVTKPAFTVTELISSSSYLSGMDESVTGIATARVKLHHHAASSMTAGVGRLSVNHLSVNTFRR